MLCSPLRRLLRTIKRLKPLNEWSPAFDERCRCLFRVCTYMVRTLESLARLARGRIS